MSWQLSRRKMPDKPTPTQALAALAELLKNPPRYGSIEISITYHAGEIREIETVLREKNRGEK